MPEDRENVECICPECSKKKYPMAGKFTEREVKFATHVKKAFGREHMWVKILKHDETGVLGTVDNEAVLPTSPKLGDMVHVDYSEIEDVG